jgi:hypothetical protein
MNTVASIKLLEEANLPLICQSHASVASSMHASADPPGNVPLGVPRCLWQKLKMGGKLVEFLKQLIFAYRTLSTMRISSNLEVSDFLLYICLFIRDAPCH